MALSVFAIVALSVASATASDGNTMKAFHDAAQAGETETVRTMLEADPQLAISVDKYGFPPIHLLDMNPDEDVLNLLLANGADINAVNDEGVICAVRADKRPASHAVVD